MKCKKLISAVCAVVMAAGMAGVPAVGNVFGADTAISASADTFGAYEYSALDDGTISITKYNGSDTTLIIPDTIDGKSVTKIGVNCFNRCTSLKSVVIPDSVKVIGSTSFGGCSNLASINIPDSVDTIGEGAFNACTSLTSVTLPNKETFISTWAFIDCTSLKTVTIPQNITVIGYQAFGFHWGNGNYEPISNFKVYCYSGSAGEKYAKDNGFNYELLDGGSSTSKTSISKATAKFSATAVSYTGKSKMPKLTVTYGGKTLVKGKDYKVSGKNCKNPGKATITITGIGNYTGTKTMNFYIVPQKPTLTKATSTTKKKISLAWKRDSLADGYQIIVYSDKTCKTKVKSAMVKKNTTVKGSLSGFTSGKTYYVRMRAYKTIDGKKKAGAFCAVKTVKVK